MAFTGITKVFKAETATRSVDGLTLIQPYYVYTDSAGVTPGQVTLATHLDHSIPRYGEPHDTEPHAYVRNVVARRRDGKEPKAWVVVVTYKSQQGGDLPEQPDDPLQRRPIWSWSDVSIREVYTVDELGVPVLNTAGDPYNPPLTRERRIPVLNLLYNAEFYSQAMATAFYTAVNTDAGGFFTVVGYDVPDGVAKLMKFVGAPHYEGGRRFFKITVALHFKRFVWHSVLDATAQWYSGWDDFPISIGFQSKVHRPIPFVGFETRPILVEQWAEQPDPLNPGSTILVRQGHQPVGVPQKLDANGVWIQDIDQLPAVQRFVPNVRQPFRALVLPERR